MTSGPASIPSIGGKPSGENPGALRLFAVGAASPETGEKFQKLLQGGLAKHDAAQVADALTSVAALPTPQSISDEEVAALYSEHFPGKEIIPTAPVSELKVMAFNI